MDKWLKDYIEIELKKPKTTLDFILDLGFIKVDMDLRHFEVYKKENTRILYNLNKKEIDTFYDVRKVFGGLPMKYLNGD